MRSRLSLRVQGLEELGDLVVVEAGEGEIDFRSGVQLSQEACEQLLVPGAGDPIEGQIQQPGLVARQDPARITGTEARPSLRAASRRWCPPMTDLSSRTGYDRIDEPEPDGWSG